MKILSFIFGNTLKTIASRSGIIVFILMLLFFYDKYNDAISRATTLEIERDKEKQEKMEYKAYNTLLLAQKDSLIYLNSVDKENFKIIKKDLQSIISQQRQRLKEKEATIDEMRKGLKCKNWLGKIVDC